VRVYTHVPKIKSISQLPSLSNFHKQSTMPRDDQGQRVSKHNHAYLQINSYLPELLLFSKFIIQMTMKFFEFIIDLSYKKTSHKNLAFYRLWF
jgi:hypothetical protein